MNEIVYSPRLNAWCHTASGACSRDGEAPALPTYQTIADVLEKKNGAGIRLAWWTIARTALIAAPMLLVGVPRGKAIKGSLLASAAISGLTLLRLRINR